MRNRTYLGLSRKCSKHKNEKRKKKKRKYLKDCLEQNKHFTPFVSTVDGVLGNDAKTTLNKIASVLAVRWDKSPVTPSTHLRMEPG
mmetsp:Transcript_31119/g.46026  ORF Transcript_31119/g.46026 Transcript_31119/m.46026 type:complete len:86 (-) Transcript_31119:101-358(-)